MATAPLARATADRFMFETGNLKYLAAILPRGALDRPVPGGAWTVRQTLAHLADSPAGYAKIIQQVRGGLPVEPSRFDPSAHNSEVAAANRKTKLPVIVDRMNEALRRLVEQLVAVDEAALRLKVGLYDLSHVLAAWSKHAAGHVMEMMETLPELRDDHMILNWLLYEDFSDRPAHLVLQQRLLQEVRERYAQKEETEP